MNKSLEEWIKYYNRCIDSYSKDNTVKIAKKYGAKVLYESKKGPAVARNTGAKKAKGEILIFPDADVRFEEDFLSNLCHDIELQWLLCAVNYNRSQQNVNYF